MCGWSSSVSERGGPLLVAMLALAIAAGNLRADVINVPDDHPTIQSAIDAAAQSGDEIRVAPGTYNETIDFLGKALRLYSSAGPARTTIDGTGFEQSVVRCTSGEGPSTILEGFTITGGIGNGGGMSNAGTSPTVQGCVFTLNGGPGLSGIGGGVYNDGGHPTFRDCVFSRNMATFGAGMLNSESHPVLFGCTFVDNEAGEFDGAIGNWGGTLTAYNCRFVGNSAIDGGAISNSGGETLLVGCEFSGNTAARGGALFANFGSHVTVVNSTLQGNHGALGGGAMYIKEATLAAFNCIVWGNTPVGRQIVYSDATVDLRYCIVERGWPGKGNDDRDPMFEDPDGVDNILGTLDDDVRLQAGSPGIDAGINNAVPADRFDLDGDGDTMERIPLDPDGHPRFAADEFDFDPGCGVPVVVDIGVYEYQGDPAGAIFVGDIDGDGVVGFIDLTEVISRWGPCDADCCLADLDSSGAVGFDDLLIVLSGWR